MARVNGNIPFNNNACNKIEVDIDNIDLQYANIRVKAIISIILHLIHIKYEIPKNNNIKKLVKLAIKVTINEIRDYIKNKEVYKTSQSTSNSSDVMSFPSQIEITLDIINVITLDLNKLNNTTYVNKYNEMKDFIKYTVILMIDEMLYSIFYSLSLK